MNDKNLLPRLFGEALSRLRTAKDMNRAQLARLTGQQHIRITQFEQGQVDPRLSTVLDLAKALGVKPGELLDDMAEKLIEAEKEANSQK